MQKYVFSRKKHTFLRKKSGNCRIFPKKTDIFPRKQKTNFSRSQRKERRSLHGKHVKRVPDALYVRRSLQKIRYNQEEMGGGDSNDRMKLARRTSCEMNLVSKRWDWSLFWGLMGIAITNAFVLYTFFHKTTAHSHFFFELAFEWFKSGTM